MLQLDTNLERLQELVEEHTEELTANPPLLICTKSPESLEVQKYLTQHGIMVRIAHEQTNLPPLLIGRLGLFLGLFRIKGFVQMEENGFNKYVNALLKSTEDRR